MSKFANVLKCVAAACATVVLSGGAWAANCGVYATTATSQGGAYVGGASSTYLTTANLTLNGGNASDCYGQANLPNSNNPTDVTASANSLKLWYDQGGTQPATWITAARDGTNLLNPSYGFSFAVTGFTTTTLAGSFNLVITDLNGAGTAPDLPLKLDVLITDKGGQNTDYFFFNDTTITANSTPGTYTMGVVFNNGKKDIVQGLSDFTVMVRDLSPTNPNCAPTDPTCQPQQVPEPGSLALVGLALLAGVAVQRRRRS